MSKTIPFQAIPFSISTQINSIRPIDRTLSGDTTLDQSGPGSDGSEGVLCTSQSSCITGTLPSYCLESYPGHCLRGVLPPSHEWSMDCVCRLCEFDLLSRYYIYFQAGKQEKNIIPPITPQLSIHSITAVFSTKLALAVNKPWRLTCH